MREHRWESASSLSFPDILSLTEKLSAVGLSSTHPTKDMITYIEEWEVPDLDSITQLAPWATEDVTLLHVFDQWHGDFFLFVGGYHTVFQRHQSVNTYCSVAHPWALSTPFKTIHPRAWLWVGFRHTHGFLRVRVHTTQIIAPGESEASLPKDIWLKDREASLRTAIDLLDLPIDVDTSTDKVVLHTLRQDCPLFCSWPDAFGPSQFELNSPDPFEFLVPASQLAATCSDSAGQVRAYLTGFSLPALREFNPLSAHSRLMYRCSLHCQLKEVPEIFALLKTRGRIYGSLAEFQTSGPLPHGTDAAAIIGFVGSEGHFHVEIRLNQHPLSHQETEQWLEHLLGHDLVYAPLPVFP